MALTQHPLPLQGKLTTQRCKASPYHSSLFRQVQPELGPYPPAPSALAATLTTCTTAHPKPCGMAPPHIVKRTRTVASPTPQGASYAWTGNAQMGVPQWPTTPGTNAPGVANKLTELRNVLGRRRLDAGTPYDPSPWHRHLQAANLLDKYPTIPHCLQFSFDAGIRPISHTFAPPNRPTINEYKAEFDELVQIELQKEGTSAQSHMRKLSPCWDPSRLPPSASLRNLGGLANTGSYKISHPPIPPSSESPQSTSGNH